MATAPSSAPAALASALAAMAPALALSPKWVPKVTTVVATIDVVAQAPASASEPAWAHEALKMLAAMLYGAALAPVALPRPSPWPLASSQGAAATASPMAFALEASAVLPKKEATPAAAVDTRS